MPTAGAPGTAAASATGFTRSCRPSSPTVGKVCWRRLVSWRDTSAGSVAGVSARWRAGLQALPERKDQRKPAGLTWAWPWVVEQPDEFSAPDDQPAVLASAAGSAAQAPPVRTARPDNVTLPCFTPGVTVDASMLIMVTWHGHPVTAADSQP